MRFQQQNILFQLLQFIFQLEFAQFFRQRIGDHRQSLIAFLQFLPVVFQTLRTRRYRTISDEKTKNELISVTGLFVGVLFFHCHHTSCNYDPFAMMYDAYNNSVCGAL